MTFRIWIGLGTLVGLVAPLGCGGSEAPPPAAATAPAATAAAHSAEEAAAEPAEFRYRVTLHSACTAEMPDGQQNAIDADASFDYTWRFRGPEAELLVHRIDDQTTLGDQPMVQSTRSRERFHAQRGDEVLVDASLETAEEPLKSMLEASFDRPLCTVTLDESGREVGRETTADPNAKLVLDDGIIANARLFHGPFPAGKSTWQAPAEISMGGGRYASGTLSYTLVQDPRETSLAPPEQVSVRVAGELTGGSDEGPAGRESVTYRLRGAQVYDRSLNRWISGEFDVAMESEIGSGAEKIVATGTTKIEMGLVGSRPAGAARTASRPAAGLK